MNFDMVDDLQPAESQLPLEWPVFRTFAESLCMNVARRSAS